VDGLERRANKHRDVLDKYAWMGLVILTAVPLPGTGAWTSSLLAALTGVRLKHAFPAIALGVVIAAVVIGTLSYGVAALV
ncbi:MAG: small multi-drug export protein, partial [Clostridiales bacterium]|nr:small multi-drug export protein [Clostridiales bacterium]